MRTPTIPCTRSSFFPTHLTLPYSLFCFSPTCCMHMWWFLVLCKQMIGTSTRLPPIQRLVEIKTIAEQLHFKISTLLLHGGKLSEAVIWFHQHKSSYDKVVGSTEYNFLHWEWMSRQFLVCAELLETSSATVQNFSSLNQGTAEIPLTEFEFYPAYYYQVSPFFSM